VNQSVEQFIAESGTRLEIYFLLEMNAMKGSDTKSNYSVTSGLASPLQQSRDACLWEFLSGSIGLRS